jgi:hypothetical protein
MISDDLAAEIKAPWKLPLQMRELGRTHFEVRDADGFFIFGCYREYVAAAFVALANDSDRSREAMAKALEDAREHLAYHQHPSDWARDPLLVSRIDAALAAYRSGTP